MRTMRAHSTPTNLLDLQVNRLAKYTNHSETLAT
jgi:hypothetical protein